MLNDSRNAEGYKDPTPYAAIKNLREGPPFMPLVYICSPYSSNPEANNEITRKFCRFALDKGQIPLAPQLMFPQFMDDYDERELAIFMDIVLMGKCQEVWVLGNEITEGMKAELAKAKVRRQKIRYFNSDFEEE